jgi:hypothetical protein
VAAGSASFRLAYCVVWTATRSRDSKQE